MGHKGHVLTLLLLPITALAGSMPAHATVTELEREIRRIEQEYSDRHAALQREMNRRLAVLDAKIVALTARPPTDPHAGSDGASKDDDHALNITGDFRLRYEHTAGHPGDQARDRGVLRGRLGASYAVNERFLVAGRVTTGDPGDPNSADITMGNFVDDLALSLDQAFASYRVDGFEFVGGKFVNPFIRTELVWDGDVSPYGVAGRYRLYRDSTVVVRVAGIYSLIDEQIAAQGSDMRGAQVSLDVKPAAGWDFGLNAAYYDYEIGSLLAADSGDTRDNNLIPDGTGYLSDFDLLDFIVRAGYSGPSSRWPLQIIGNYVRNLGAIVPEDAGWSVDFRIGELGETRDWRFGYGYAAAETDAVLAAFSHDNTTYATNYRQHTISVDYLAFDGTILNLSGYLYRRADANLLDQRGDDEWLSRVRLNLQFSF